MTSTLAALGALTLALVVVEALLGASAHGVRGGAALSGFAGCVLIVVVSKWLGKRFLQRPDDGD